MQKESYKYGPPLPPYVLAFIMLDEKIPSSQ